MDFIRLYLQVFLVVGSVASIVEAFEYTGEHDGSPGDNPVRAIRDTCFASFLILVAILVRVW